MFRQSWWPSSGCTF